MVIYLAGITGGMVALESEKIYEIFNLQTDRKVV